MHMDRMMLTHMDKANAAAFGAGTLWAFPCTSHCMEELAQGYKGAHAPLVRKLCAIIALGRPIPNDWRGQPGPNGGERVEQKPKPPTKPSGGIKVDPYQALKEYEGTISF
jgi:hypothetical protein